MDQRFFQMNLDRMLKKVHTPPIVLLYCVDQYKISSNVPNNYSHSNSDRCLYHTCKYTWNKQNKHVTQVPVEFNIHFDMVKFLLFSRYLLRFTYTHIHLRTLFILRKKNCQNKTRNNTVFVLYISYHLFVNVSIEYIRALRRKRECWFLQFQKWRAK